MLKTFHLYLIVLLCVMVCNACNDSISFLPRNLNRKPPSDFIKEIPIYKEGRSKGKIDDLYKYINQDASQLKLDSLELGFDSLQIRIWLGHSMAMKRHVVVLNFTDKKWQGYLVTFSNSDTISSKTIQKIKPKLGWDNFIKQMYNLKILTLPDESDIDGYNGCGGDGDPFYFEWATEKKYRFYHYCNPGENKVKYWQAENVLKIASLLEKEFNFEYQKSTAHHTTFRLLLCWMTNIFSPFCSLSAFVRSEEYH